MMDEDDQFAQVPVKIGVLSNKLSLVLLASRPQFLAASVAPVLVGSALGYKVAGAFDVGLFLLALPAIMAIHAGANMTNDYFDHRSRNDWVNTNPTPFSGGRRFIQDGVLSPRATLLAGLGYLGIGCGIGLVIVALTQSLFILAIGVVGVLGGYCYTAGPLRLGYRGVGEVVIGFLFGILPVYGSYYLQTRTFNFVPLLPALVVAVLIFLVILINEFPDLAADRHVHKKTLVVWLGLSQAVWIYRIALGASYLLAALMLARRETFYAGLFYLLSVPLGIFATKSANEKDLATPGLFRANRNTVALHTVGCLALAAGALVPALFQ